MKGEGGGVNVEMMCLIVRLSLSLVLVLAAYTATPPKLPWAPSRWTAAIFSVAALLKSKEALLRRTPVKPNPELFLL